MHHFPLGEPGQFRDLREIRAVVDDRHPQQVAVRARAVARLDRSHRGLDPGRVGALRIQMQQQRPGGRNQIRHALGRCFGERRVKGLHGVEIGQLDEQPESAQRRKRITDLAT